MFKSEKGITLVALVITIVILIILATVSISFAVNGGLFEKSEKGAQMYSNSAVDEEKVLNEAYGTTANLMYHYTNGLIKDQPGA